MSRARKSSSSAGKKKRPSASIPPITFGMVSLGCPKNLVDSEKIAANLLEAGFALCEDETSADIVIINTCSFIAPARKESDSVIGDFAALRRTGKLRALVIAGCMVQQQGRALFERFPEIDAGVSFSAYGGIAGIVRSVLENRGRLLEGNWLPRLDAETGRLIMSGPFSAYLRIAEGCSNTCTFCTIPAIRGPFRSKPPGAVLEEARELIEFGMRELVLIAQDTTCYGADLGGRADIADLISSLSKLDGAGWIRLMYANPARINDALIRTIAESSAVVDYLDIPIQHVSDRILRKMGRGQSEKAIRNLVERLNHVIPDLVLRTSVMVGFPGETDEDFRRLLGFVKEGHFQRLGAFRYSREEGTPSAKMKGLPDEKAAAGRLDELMLAQQEVAFQFARGLVGTSVETLIEAETEPGRLEGRTYMDAPEIDCRAYIRSSQLRPGETAVLEVVDSNGYDLILSDSQ